MEQKLGSVTSHMFAVRVCDIIILLKQLLNSSVDVQEYVIFTLLTFHSLVFVILVVFWMCFEASTLRSYILTCFGDTRGV